MSREKSIDRMIGDVKRLLRDLPPASITFVDDETSEVLFVVGKGPSHDVRVRPDAVAYFRWLWDQLSSGSDLSGEPITLIGDNRSGHPEAAVATAFLIALTRAKFATVFIAPYQNWFDVAHEAMRWLLPPSWRHDGDEEENEYVLGRDARVSFVSIRAQKLPKATDVVVVDEYSSASHHRVLELLERAPVRVICGEAPTKKQEEWICEVRDGAHRAGRLFRFHRDEDEQHDRLILSVDSMFYQRIENFWRPTGIR